MNDEPICILKKVPLKEANFYLEKWQHKMGPLARGKQGAVCHMLYFRDEPMAVTTASNLISSNIAGQPRLTRENTIELSRLCACRANICRVALRMWREFIFPELGYSVAISYQDKNLHTGNIYRFDGWKKIGYSHSGKDTRTGRLGRDKYIWAWPTNYNEITRNDNIPYLE